MLIRHATPRKNVESILATGLLTSYARGKLPAVWFHCAGKTPWAILHVSKRHKVGCEDVVIVTAKVPDHWLVRHASGLWYCRRDIPAERILEALDFASVVAPGADE